MSDAEEYFTTCVSEPLGETFFDSILRLHVYNSKECSICSYTSTVNANFLIAQVPLEQTAQGVTLNLQELWDNAYTCQLFNQDNSGANTRFCEGTCNRETLYIEQNGISPHEVQPPYVIMQLKRFNNMLIPITTQVYAPENHFVIDSSLDDTPLYSLFAILIRTGGTQLLGHYITLIKNPGGQWYEFNDTSVRRLPLHEYNNLCKGGYLYVYKRQ
jgi:ubiquitin C-terminal hydrolase